jgi:hypothetical protein
VLAIWLAPSRFLGVVLWLVPELVVLVVLVVLWLCWCP